MVSRNKGRVMVKDKNGTILSIFKTDPRYLDSEFIHMNKGRIHPELRNTFIAKDINGFKYRITKDNEEFKSGKLFGLRKGINIKVKEPIVKNIKPRKKPEKTENFRNAQVSYNVNKRAEKYLNFKYDIYKNGNFYTIKDFCIHGDLKISISLFDQIYFKLENNLNLYCDKCRKDFLDKTPLSLIDINYNRDILKDLYKQGSAKLKENFIKKNYIFLYECIQRNNTYIEIDWNEKVFLFKENLTTRPKCLVDDCNEESFFSKSNQRYTNFCTKHIKGFQSKGELELFNFLKATYNSVEKLRLKNYEFDAYIPELKLAFEFNGLYWHSSEFKDKKYHYNKWKFCKDNDINLITIWEDDWNFKQEIVKSIINNKLGVNINKIGARECEIKLVNNKESKEFLEQNHLQGNCNSTIKLGLYYKDELVSLMTFGKRNIGRKTQFEMLRFCSKHNTNISGGGSKLWKYFLNNYEFDKIISYANCDISNGKFYLELNFKEIRHTGFNFWWSDNINRFHRSKFMKYKLKEDNEKTGEEIMNNKGYKKIFGIGNLLFEYINKIK